MFMLVFHFCFLVWLLSDSTVHFLLQIWVGTKDGTIFIYMASSRRLWKTIKAHEDSVRALCAAESRYVMTGAGSKDGKVAIWSPLTSTFDQSGTQPGDE